MAYTRVIDRDAVTAAPAQQVVDGLACVLPKQVPQSHINRRDCAHLGTGKSKKFTVATMLLQWLSISKTERPTCRLAKTSWITAATARGT